MDRDLGVLLTDLAAELAPELISFARRLIRIPSVTGEERVVSECVLGEMAHLGYDRAFRDNWGNIVGVIEGAASPAGSRPTILFTSHLDVVEEGHREAWQPYDPFCAALDSGPAWDETGEARETTQLIHGRGASDAKGPLAAQVYAGALLLGLRARGVPLPGRFVTVQAAMEEPGDMFSMRRFVAETMPQEGLDVDAVICGEPSSLRIALGHRGRVELQVTVHGKGCHGSSPWLGVNAAVHAARLITAVEDHIRTLPDEPGPLGRAGIALTQLFVEPNALAIIPDKARLVFDRRTVPGESVESVLAEMQGIIDALAAQDPDFRAEVEVGLYSREAYTGLTATSRSAKESWTIAPGHPFVQACGEALAGLGEQVRYTYWPFSTDVPAFASLGKPCIGYSGGQEYSIHTEQEVVRTDFLTRSLLGNAAIFLRAARLPEAAFSL